MQWYENTIDVDGTEVCLKGIYLESDSIILITYDFNHEGKRVFFCPWSKTVNLWTHQEILAEDIRSKFLGKIKKVEHNLPVLVEKAKTKQDVFKMTDQKTETDIRRENDNHSS